MKGTCHYLLNWVYAWIKASIVMHNQLRDCNDTWEPEDVVHSNEGEDEGGADEGGADEGGVGEAEDDTADEGGLMKKRIITLMQEGLINCSKLEDCNCVRSLSWWMMHIIRLQSRTYSGAGEGAAK